MFPCGMNVRRPYVQTDYQYPTGKVTVKLSAGGQPSYIIHENVAWDFIDVRNDMLAGWLRGKTAIEAAEMGNLLGAFVVSHRGAIPDYDNAIHRRLGL